MKAFNKKHNGIAATVRRLRRLRRLERKLAQKERDTR